MAVKYVNIRDIIYYLHHGLTRTGRDRYYFSRDPEGDLADSVPAGFEIYENPNGQVFLRKAAAKLITDAELALVRDGIAQFSRVKYYKVEVKKNAILIYLPDQDPEDILEIYAGVMIISPRQALERAVKRARYSPVFRFVLADKTKRLFNADRWCYRGSVDDWINLSWSQKLPPLVKKYCPHLGQDSFFDLI